MKSTTVRRTTLAIAVTAALTGVAACGAGGTSGDPGKEGKAAGQGVTHVSPLAALRLAAASTDKADSARVDMTVSMGSLMSMKGSGAFAWGGTLSGAMTLTYTGGTVADAMRATGTTSMRARYLSDAYYARMSDQFARQAGGKHWIRYGYDDIAKLGGGSGAYMKDQMQNNTPNQSVKLLLASGDVKKAGEEQVLGRHTTHYHGTVNVADLAARTSRTLSASQLADIKKQLSRTGITTETVDLWVNDENLLVKKSETADTRNGTLTTTASYRDYGVEVSVMAPPKSDTLDFKALAASQGAGAGAS
nr:lipoprotein [Streptomyces sp. Xyl84]